MWTSADTPQTSLTGLHAEVVRRNDSFHTFLMSGPAGTDSIWVTLGRLDWSWSGAAHRIGELPDGNEGDNGGGRQGRNWNGPFGAQWTVNPAGVATSDLPQWTTIFGNRY